MSVRLVKYEVPEDIAERVVEGKTEAARLALRGVTRNADWPVRTGRSLRGFRVREGAQGFTITNTTDYADVVEERLGRIRDWWAESADDLLEEAYG